MRRNEITPELIEFSKRAKKLGFPQDVECGDFVCYINTYGNREISVVTKTVSSKTFWLGDGSYILPEDEWFLILSFSRCLEWLRERAWELRTLQERTHRQKGFERWHIEIIKVHPKMFSMKHHYMDNAKTHHEAIAKSICRILEENKDATTKR